MTLKDILNKEIKLNEPVEGAGCFIEIGLPINLWCGNNPEYLSKEEGLELAVLIKTAVSLGLKMNSDSPAKGLMELDRYIPTDNLLIDRIIVENTALRKEISYMRYGFILSTIISTLCILGSVGILIFKP